MERTAAQAELLGRYNTLLVEKNRFVNLTAHRTQEESELYNVCDSLLFEDVFEEMFQHIGAAEVLDIGSGGGCPAVPLGIVFPELRITMLDSTRKKVDFLNETARELGCVNLRAVHARAEDYANDNKAGAREKFDFVTARAVAALPTLLEYALPFLKTGGIFFAFKGKNWQQEADAAAGALKALGGRVAAVHTKELDCGIERALVVVEKVHATDRKYPRAGNAPRIKPLQ